MTALPTTEQLLPSSQTLSVAFSIAEVAMANTRSEQVKALQDLKDAIGDFRVSLGRIRSVLRDSPEGKEIARSTPEEIRKALDTLLEAEHVGTKLYRILSELLERGSLRTTIVDATLPLTYGEISDFARELSLDYLASVRECRLEIVSFIATNARDNGLNVIEISDDFKQLFLTSPIEETEGWQETAYLLADVEDAKLLDQSIKSAARDHTDDILAAK